MATVDSRATATASRVATEAVVEVTATGSKTKATLPVVTASRVTGKVSRLHSPPARLLRPVLPAVTLRPALPKATELRLVTARATVSNR